MGSDPFTTLKNQTFRFHMQKVNSLKCHGNNEIEHFILFTFPKFLMENGKKFESKTKYNKWQSE